MPIHYESIDRQSQAYKNVVSSLIKDYEVERHLPEGFDLTVDILNERFPDLEAVPPLKMDLSTRKIVLHAGNFSDKVAAQAQVRAELEASIPREGKPSKKEFQKRQRLIDSKVEESLASEREKALRQAIEPRFREAVMGPLLLCTLNPEERLSLTQIILKKLPQDHLYKRRGNLFWTESYWARKEFYDAVQGLLPYPRESGSCGENAQKVPRKRGGNLEFYDKLNQLVTACGAHWFSNKGTKLEALPQMHSEVDKGIRARLKKKLDSKLRLGTYKNDEVPLVSVVLQEKDLQWVNAQEMDGNYNGLILFNEEGFVGQENACIDTNTQQWQLVIHKQRAFADGFLPPALAPIKVSVAYANGAATCTPIARVLNLSETELTNRLRQASNRYDLTPYDLTQSEFDPTVFDSSGGAFFHTSLHWLRSDAQEYTLHPWAHTEEPIRSQLLARPEISEKSRNVIRALLAATSTPRQEASIDDILLRVTQTHETAQRQGINADEQQSRAQLQQSASVAFDLQLALPGAQEKARSHIQQEQDDLSSQLQTDWEQARQALVQEPDRLGLSAQETDERLVIDLEQTQEKLSLQKTAIAPQEAMLRAKIQSEEAEKSQEFEDGFVQSRQLSRCSEQERQSRQVLEDAQQQQSQSIEVQEQKEFLKMSRLAIAAQEKHLHQQAMKLAQEHKQLSTHEAALAYREQALQLDNTQLHEGQARLQIETAESEARQQVVCSLEQRIQAAVLKKERILNQQEQDLRSWQRGLECGSRSVAQSQRALVAEQQAMQTQQQDLQQREQALLLWQQRFYPRGLHRAEKLQHVPAPSLPTDHGHARLPMMGAEHSRDALPYRLIDSFPMLWHNPQQPDRLAPEAPHRATSRPIRTGRGMNQFSLEAIVHNPYTAKHPPSILGTYPGNSNVARESRAAVAHAPSSAPSRRNLQRSVSAPGLLEQSRTSSAISHTQESGLRNNLSARSRCADRNVGR